MNGLPGLGWLAAGLKLDVVLIHGCRRGRPHIVIGRTISVGFHSLRCLAQTKRAEHVSVLCATLLGPPQACKPTLDVAVALSRGRTYPYYERLTAARGGQHSVDWFVGLAALSWAEGSSLCHVPVQYSSEYGRSGGVGTLARLVVGVHLPCHLLGMLRDFVRRQ